MMTWNYVFRAGLMALAFAAGGASPVWAGPLEDGLAAFDRRDYAEALRLLHPLAEKGEPAAQTGLGYMYNNGLGVPPSPEEAVQWYRRAAEQGHAKAQNNLGFMFATGRGVKLDFQLAYMWFQLAQTRGDPDAAANRDLAGSKLTPEQIAEAKKMAAEWKPAR